MEIQNFVSRSDAGFQDQRIFQDQGIIDLSLLYLHIFGRKDLRKDLYRFVPNQ